MRIVKSTEFAKPEHYEELMTPLWAKVFFPGTVNLVTAPMKAGKSSFLYAWAGAMARGEEWGGITPVKPLQIAYFDLENPEGIQYSKIQYRKHDNLYVTQAAWKEDFTIPGLTKSFTEAGWWPDVIIIEPLIFAVDVRNENDNREMGRAIKHYMRFARESRKCVILVHHDRKPQTDQGIDDPRYSTRGASAIGGAIDMQMNIVIGRQHRWLQVTFNRFGTDDDYEPKFILEYDNETKLSSGKRVLF